MRPGGYTRLPALRTSAGAAAATTADGKSSKGSAATQPKCAAADNAGVAATWHAGYRSSLSSSSSSLNGQRLPPIAVTATAADGTCEMPTAGRRDMSSRSLARKQRALENADAVASVVKQEKGLRSVIAGTEYEERHAMLWRHQGGLVKLRRYDAAAHARRAAREQLLYTRAVEFYREVGLTVSEELAARDLLLQEEYQDRCHIASLCEEEQLHREAEQLVDELIRSEAFFEDTDEVRRVQMAQMGRYYRMPKVDESPIRRFVSEVRLGDGKAEEEAEEAEEAEAVKKVYLMSYAVNEEEFLARQRLRYAEMLERLPFEHEHTARCCVAAEEAAARRGLLHWCSQGACQSRLSAVLKIQSWWRLTTQQRWTGRTRDAFTEGLRRCRDARTAADWNRRLSKMIPEPGDVEGAQPPPRDFADELQRLEAAATLPSYYTMEMDYYLYTLTERVRSAVDCQRCDFAASEEEMGSSSGDDGGGGGGGGGASGPSDDDAAVASAVQHVENALYLRSRPVIPHRVFFLRSQQRLAHYPKWRRNRWCGGSLRYIGALAGVAEREAQEREALVQRQRRDADGLYAFAAALSGDTVERHLHTLAIARDEEAMERHLVEEEWREADGILQVTCCAVTSLVESILRPFLLLREEEVTARAAVEEEEAAAMETGLQEYHWRWARLGAYRQRLASRYATKRGWLLAVHGGGAGSKFVSLDSAARVLQRFATCVLPRVKAQLARERREQRRLQREQERDPESDKRLRGLSRTLTQQLDALKEELWTTRNEERQEDAEPPVSKKDAASHREVALNTAARTFCGWFDAEAEQPRDLQYKEVLSRFHHQHMAFFHSLNCLLLFLREARQRIEDDEAQERRNMQHRLAYRVAVSHSIVSGEHRSRMYLEADEEDQRGRLIADSAAAKSVVSWGVVAKQLPARRVTAVTKSALATKLPLPKLTPMQRLLSREEVHRTAIARKGLRGFTDYLFDFSLPFRESLVALQSEDLPVVCTNIDCLFDGRTPPIARLAVVRSDEATARAALAAEGAAMSYASPLLRSHNMFLKETLWPQFLIGHLTLSSNGAYMDHRLVVLLKERVGHMGAKLADLVQLEESSRRRIAYLEEVRRELRFVLGKGFL